MERLVNFINSSAGLIILGFLVTSVGGNYLNNAIQREKLNNERVFEMYKTRLIEAKDLQKKLLESSTARVFYLGQILSKLEDKDQKQKDIQDYWSKNYTCVKDDWNKNLVYWHAQMRILFSGNLSSLLSSEKENRLPIEANVKKYLDDSLYTKELPKTVHGAFVNAHATIYHLTFKCEENSECEDFKALWELARKQMQHLTLLHDCFSYGISGELLVDPYGPKKEYLIPEHCNRAFKDAMQHKS